MRPVRGRREISRLYWIMYKIYGFMQMRAKILTCFSEVELECPGGTLAAYPYRPPNLTGARVVMIHAV